MQVLIQVSMLVLKGILCPVVYLLIRPMLMEDYR